MEDKIKNLKKKLDELTKQIDEAPGWGEYTSSLLDKQRNLMRELSYWQKELEHTR